MLIYKGFIGQIDFDNETQGLIGEVVNSVDLIEFSGSSAAEIKLNFQRAVDEYIGFQREVVGIQPIPFVGNFTICLSTDKQNKVISAARNAGQSVNHWLNRKVDVALSELFAKSA